MALDTVADYITAVRALLQDTIETYRYSDADLIAALNYGILEMRRLRPDLLSSYFATSLPTYSASGDYVDVDPQYRMSLVYYIAGHLQLRDDENTQDARAAIFLNKFTSQMLDIKA